ncbi:hypothetical protein [Microlunatus speluncae]|uniref:hypothetical protein n=1 Tax=Microlunatus speluncae TaxID=2594267 RepID=UPI0012667377|nr:hypothetical protein [Microlunatus speluncae]
MARPSKLRERAVRLGPETMVRGEYPTEFEAIRTIAGQLGIGPTETLPKWVRQSEVDHGERPVIRTEDIVEIEASKKENADLLRAK